MSDRKGLSLIDVSRGSFRRAGGRGGPGPAETAGPRGGRTSRSLAGASPSNEARGTRAVPLAEAHSVPARSRASAAAGLRAEVDAHSVGQVEGGASGGRIAVEHLEAPVLSGLDHASRRQ